MAPGRVEAHEGPLRLCDLLEGLFPSELREELRLSCLASAWEGMLGPLSRCSRPVSLREGVLLVVCSSHQAAHALSRSRGLLLSRIGERFGPWAREVLVRVEVGGVPPRAAGRGDAPRAPGGGKIPPFALEISDPALRRSFVSAYRALRRRSGA